MKHIFAAACVFLITALSSFADPVVTSITITDNRVMDGIVRHKLAFRVGDTINDDKIASSRSNLYEMGLFKTLDINVQADGQNGAAVTVKAKDGWFVLPWVMAGSRGGERYTGLMLMEQNFFRHAEKLIYFGMYQNSLSFDTFAVTFQHFGVSAAFDRRDYTEYRYQDGAYNSTTMIGRGFDELNEFGAIGSYYNRYNLASRFNLSVPLSRKVKVFAGVNSNTSRYSALSGGTPGAEGSFKAIQFGASYGRADNSRDFSGSFARIFGMGMADHQENFKRLTASTSDWGIQTNVETSFKEIGSEHDYAKAVVSASHETKFSNYDRLLFAARLGFGSTVPFSQLYATNRRDGMTGVYAREFRGDTMYSGSANYRYAILRNKVGTLNADIFTEAASLKDAAGEGYSKQGVGCNLSWQFWRFPLPIGFGYTYCVDDNNWQATFAVGGMF